MWIGDVGQGRKEEVNYRPAGSTGGVNYGWRCYEGSIPTPGVPVCTPPDYIPPVFDYDNPASGGASVVGGFVYRGSEYPQFAGYYIAADVYSGTVYLIKPNGSGGWITTSQIGLQNIIVSFGEGEDGTLYAASQATNTVYKVVATGPLPVTLIHFNVTHTATGNEVKWTTTAEQNTAAFYIEYSPDGINFQRAGKVAASRNTSGSNYNYRHVTAATGSLFYRLAIEEDNGQLKYSTILKVFANGSNIKIYPTMIRDGVLNISITQPAAKLQLINSNGRLCFEKNMNNLTGSSAIPLPNLAKGIYVVQVISNGDVFKEKIVIQ
jgi:hypothetical protein